MLVTLVVGIFLVLRAGQHLRAPTDVSGTWELEPTHTGTARRMTVVQSGQYVTVFLDASRRLDLKLDSATIKHQTGGAVRMTDGEWTLTFDAAQPATRRSIVVSGPIGVATYDAQRVARPFVDVPAKPSESAVAADAQ